MTIFYAANSPPPILASRIDIVITLFPQRKHPGDQRRRILHIRIDNHHTVARRVVESGQHGGLFAEIARKIDIGDAWVLHLELFDKLQRPIAASVIDKQKLPKIIRTRGRHGAKRLVQKRQRGLLVVTRRKDCYLFHRLIVLNTNRTIRKLMGITMQ